MLSLRILKHLLPSGRAFDLTIDRDLRRFFVGLTWVIDDVKQYFDRLFNDVEPEDTRELVKYEGMFGLQDYGLTEAQRRDRLAATWKALGGQDPQYIQATLRARGFDVYVHEFWEPVAGRSGGSINGDVSPTIRDPFDNIWDGASPRDIKSGCGHDVAYCGGDEMFVNSQTDPPGYPLVNKVLEVGESVVGCGSEEMACGGNLAHVDSRVVVYTQKQYIMPSDTDTHPHYIYIGAQTFPNVATVPAARREELEDLALKICPTEKWLGMLINYS